MDLDMDGTVRETHFNTFGFGFRNQLTSRLDAAVLFGYLFVSQYSNPIPAAQSSSGGYIGFDLRGHLVATEKFNLHTRFTYRYADTVSREAEQKISWEWHEIELSLESQTYISESLFANFSISYLDMDGQETATGDLNQRLVFDQIDSLTAHIGLQLNLDQSGRIVFELMTGSMQGGKIVFMRDF